MFCGVEVYGSVKPIRSCICQPPPTLRTRKSGIVSDIKETQRGRGGEDLCGGRLERQGEGTTILLSTSLEKSGTDQVGGYLIREREVGRSSWTKWSIGEMENLIVREDKDLEERKSDSHRNLERFKNFGKKSRSLTISTEEKCRFK